MLGTGWFGAVASQAGPGKTVASQAGPGKTVAVVGDGAGEIPLDRRSGDVLAGEARRSWQHSIPPTKELRYSITFRPLRRRSAGRSAA